MGTWSDEERRREHDREVAFNLGAQSRDAEIARLKAEVERLRRCLVVVGDQAVALGARYGRALAAGPAALRALRSDDYSPGYVAGLVEAAQEAAMKEKP